MPEYFYSVPNNIKTLLHIDKFIVKLVINYYMNNRLTFIDDYPYKKAKGCIYDKELYNPSFKIPSHYETPEAYKYKIYKVLLKYCNSFTTYAVMELEMNTYLYFGIDYRLVLQDMLPIFSSTIPKITDSHKKNE